MPKPKLRNRNRRLSIQGLENRRLLTQAVTGILDAEIVNVGNEVRLTTEYSADSEVVGLHVILFYNSELVSSAIEEGGASGENGLEFLDENFSVRIGDDDGMIEGNEDHPTQTDNDPATDKYIFFQYTNFISPAEREIAPLSRIAFTTKSAGVARFNYLIADAKGPTESNSPTLTIGSPLPKVSLAVDPASVSEDGTGTLNYVFSRTGGDLTSPLTVDYAIDGTSTADLNDHNLPNTAASITIPANESSFELRVSPTADTNVEPDETLVLSIATSSRYVIDDQAGTASGTILNDDQLISITPPTLTADEGNSGIREFVYTVTRTGNTSAAASASYSVTGSGSNPASASDFVGNAFPSGPVQFGQNETTKSIIVQVQGDTLVEMDESFIVTLNNPSVGLQIGTATAAGVIRNDDQTALPVVNVSVNPASITENGQASFAFTFVRSGSTSGDLLVPFRIEGSAQPGSDFNAPATNSVTILDGQSSATVTINTINDQLEETDETVVLRVENSDQFTIGSAGLATGTIVDDDQQPDLPTVNVTVAPASVQEDGSENLVFTFTQTGRSEAVTVRYLVSGTATAGADYTGTTGEIVIPASGSATVTVNPTQDSTFESDETVTLTIDGNAGQGAYLVGTQLSATGTILNDDASPVPTLAISTLDANKVEGDEGLTSYTFRVTRSGLTTGETSVDYQVTGSAPNAANAEDFGGTLPSGTIVFAAGETSKTVTVQVSGDQQVEANEQFIVRLSNASDGAVITANTANGTIRDDDRPVIRSRVMTPATVARGHLIPGDSQPTAIAFRVNTTTTITVRPIGSTSLGESIRILDGDLQQVSTFANGVTEATLIGGTYGAILFEPQTTERLYWVWSSAGKEALGPSTGTNIFQPTDTNGDGVTSAVDALVVINTLNRSNFGEGEAIAPTGLLDVNADGLVSPIDALVVLNILNRGGHWATGEGEAFASPFGNAAGRIDSQNGRITLTENLLDDQVDRADQITHEEFLSLMDIEQRIHGQLEFGPRLAGSSVTSNSDLLFTVSEDWLEAEDALELLAAEFTQL